MPARIGQVVVAVDGAAHQGLEQRRRHHGRAGTGNDEHRRARTPQQQAARHGGHDQHRRSGGLPQEVRGQSDVPPRRPHTVRRRLDDPSVHCAGFAVGRRTGPRARRPPARRGPRSARAICAATGAARRSPTGRSRVHRVRSACGTLHTIANHPTDVMHLPFRRQLYGVRATGPSRIASTSSANRAGPNSGPAPTERSNTTDAVRRGLRLLPTPTRHPQLPIASDLAHAGAVSPSITLVKGIGISLCLPP